MSLITLVSSYARIYLPPRIWDVEEVSKCRSSHISLDHFLFILKSEGYDFTRHCWTVLEILGLTPTTKDGMYSLYWLKAKTASFSWSLSVNFTVALCETVGIFRWGRRYWGYFCIIWG